MDGGHTAWGSADAGPQGRRSRRRCRQHPCRGPTDGDRPRPEDGTLGPSRGGVPPITLIFPILTLRCRHPAAAGVAPGPARHRSTIAGRMSMS